MEKKSSKESRLISTTIKVRLGSSSSPLFSLLFSLSLPLNDWSWIGGNDILLKLVTFFHKVEFVLFLLVHVIWFDPVVFEDRIGWKYWDWLGENRGFEFSFKFHFVLLFLIDKKFWFLMLFLGKSAWAVAVYVFVIT